MSGSYNEILNEKVITELSSKKIYFAHQSVGTNILDGVTDITDAVSIKEITEDYSSELPVFLHSKIGENYKPLSKLNGFKEKLDSEEFSANIDVAMMKFCYVDINESTDIESLFMQYQKTYELLEEKFPQITFVHLTNPLMSQQRGLKYIIKKILGKSVYGYEDNLNRELFNNRIRETYSNIFDVAEIESTKPDGTRMVHSINGQTYYSMYHEYSDDGGHLNHFGRQVVASKLLEFLSEL